MKSKLGNNNLYDAVAQTKAAINDGLDTFLKYGEVHLTDIELFNKNHNCFEELRQLREELAKIKARLDRVTRNL
jgi:hypothetical protein